MKEEIYVYFIGTAGSGKSTLTRVFKEWMTLHGLDAITVNLDPGAENLPYTPDVDIRDWISLKEVMKEHKLGPNGAQIACADMLALNTSDIKKSIESFKTDYILMDTPGQLELFVFREAGKYIVKFLNPERSILAFLLDPSLAKKPTGFASQLLLSLSTNLRLNIPQINILSKSDMLSDDEILSIQRWADEPEEILSAISQEESSVYREMSEGIIHLLENFGTLSKLVPTSVEELKGVDDLYTNIQLLFKGGEDLSKD